MAAKRDGGYYVALGYAAMWIVSLALAVLGGIALLTGGLTFPAAIWLYAGCLIAFLSVVAVDVAYTFYRKRMALVTMAAPEVVPAEAVEAAKVQKEAKRR